MNKICNKCNVEKDITEFYNRTTSKDGHRNDCKVCSIKLNLSKVNKENIKEYGIKYRENNKEKKKEYRLNNREHINDYQKIYEKNRKEKDPIYKFIRSVKSTIKNSFNNNGYKKDSRTEHILGCSYKEFKTYIENQFEDWMIWENHGIYTGNYNDTWQYDHIEPISNANTPEDVIRLNHYTNLRPLCSRKNVEKSNK